MDTPLPLDSGLRLLSEHDRPDWKLSDTTRATGLRGVARARAALRDAARRRVGEPELLAEPTPTADAA